MSEAPNQTIKVDIATSHELAKIEDSEGSRARIIVTLLESEFNGDCSFSKNIIGVRLADSTLILTATVKKSIEVAFRKRVVELGLSAK